jgi:hypothetical protein
MFKNLLVFAKYPSVAGIIISIWVGSGILIFLERDLPIVTIIEVNLLASFVIGAIGFRVDKK